MIAYLKVDIASGLCLSFHKQDDFTKPLSYINSFISLDNLGKITRANLFINYIDNLFGHYQFHSSKAFNTIALANWDINLLAFGLESNIAIN